MNLGNSSRQFFFFLGAIPHYHHVFQFLLVRLHVHVNDISSVYWCLLLQEAEVREYQDRIVPVCQFQEILSVFIGNSSIVGALSITATPGRGRPVADSVPLPLTAICCFANTPYARSQEHTSELQPLMRTSYAVFCSKQ